MLHEVIMLQYIFAYIKEFVEASINHSFIFPTDGVIPWKNDG